jgi:hypothetical protein
MQLKKIYIQREKEKSKKKKKKEMFIIFSCQENANQNNPEISPHTSQNG